MDLSKIAQQFINHLKINRSWVNLSGSTARQPSCICYLGNWRYLSYHGYSSFKIRLAIPPSPTFVTILKRNFKNKTKKRNPSTVSTLVLRQKVLQNANFFNPQRQVKDKSIFVLQIFTSVRYWVMKSLDLGIHNLGLWRAWSSHTQLNISHPNLALLLAGWSGAEMHSYHIANSLCIKVPHKQAGLLNEIWGKGSEILDSHFWGRWSGNRECIHLPRLQSAHKMCLLCLERMALWRKLFTPLKSVSSELSWA